jgi:elongation factor G
VIDRLRREFDVEARLTPLSVAHRSTVARAAEAETKYATGAGSPGHYASLRLRVAPAAPGTGCVFSSALAPHRLAPVLVDAVRESVKRAAASDTQTCPLDVAVELVDASHRDGDGSADEFRAAAALAFREAFGRAAPVLLEPMMLLDVQAPPEYRSSIAGMILRRRGTLTALDIAVIDDPRSTSRITARIAATDLFGIAAELRDRTDGRATYTLSFVGYRPVRREDGGDDDGVLPVREPLHPAPHARSAAAAMPEPFDDRI